MAKKSFSASALTRSVTGMDAILASATSSSIPLEQIELDPVQPRRAIPAALRELWISGQTEPSAFFQSWLGQAREESHDAVDGWEALLSPSPDSSAVDEGSLTDGPNLSKFPNARAWLALVGLAADIHAVGLQQQIAVFKTGPDSYRLLFGERRFMAFCLLDWALEQGDYDKVPAAVVDEYDPFIQALENGSRQDLNAIERARQLALVLYALNPDGAPAREPGQQPGWAWYAHAADAKQHRVPRGKLELVLRACGLSHKNHVLRYRSILNIPSDVATLAEKLDWHEGKLRTLIAASGGISHHLVTLARQEAGLEPKQPKLGPSALDLTDRAVKAVRGVAKLSDDEIRAMKPQQKDSLRQTLKDLLNRL